MHISIISKFVAKVQPFLTIENKKQPMWLPLLARAFGSCLSRIELVARNQIDSLKDE